MHRTNAGEKRKLLKRDAQELEREARTLEGIKQMSPAARIRLDEAERLKAEAEALKGASQAGGPPGLADGEGQGD
jgi:hypothetical protein